MLAHLRVGDPPTPDLYLAADQFYFDLAVEEGLAEEVLPIGERFPVVLVPAGNPLGLETIEDLLHEDVAVAIAHPEQALLGRAVALALREIPSGGETMWVRLEQHATENGLVKPTVNEVANDVKSGTV